MELFLIYSDYLLAENTLTSTRCKLFCAYSATITDMNFRIRISNFCTSNCTPYKITAKAGFSVIREC